MSNENLDIITLANRVANEKENIRQAIETRGVDIPPTTPLNQYPSKIMAINTENTASDIYYRDENFDTSATSFTLPGNYGVVADGALAGYKNLKSVDLQYTNAVFPNACEGCESLTSLTANHLKYIGNDAFNKCGFTSLDNVHIQKLGSGAFANNAALQTVSLANCDEVGSGAFMYDTSLNQVNLPLCKKVDSGAFDNNTMLTDISLPEATTIENKAFQTAGKNAFTTYGTTYNISLPKVKHIGSYNFFESQGIKSIDLPECEYIMDYSFVNTNSSQPAITSLNLPKVKYIGNSCFTSNIDTDTSSKYYNYSGELYFPNCTNIGSSSFTNIKSPKLTVSNSGCSVGNFVFYNSGSLNKGVPNTVVGKLTEVGYNSFYYYNTSTDNPIPINIDFSNIEYIGNGVYTSDYSSFYLYSGRSTRLDAGKYYYTFPDGGVDFSSLKRTGSTNSNTNYYCRIFNGSAGVYCQTNLRKIWLPSTCEKFYFLHQGYNASDLLHVYTDASAGKSSWLFSGYASTDSRFTTGTSEPYIIIHFGSTHDDYIAGTYNV